MATVDSLDIQIQGSAKKAEYAIDKLVSKLDILATSLNNINGNSFRGLGESVKALSSGLQNLQGIKKSDFDRLATGIERLSAIEPGNMEAAGNALRPLADGINVLSNAKFDNKNLANLINSLTRLSNANTGSLANIDFTALGNSIKSLATALSGADKVSQNTISLTNAIAKLASAGGNIAAVTAGLPQLGTALRNFIQDMSGVATVNPDVITLSQAIGTLASVGSKTSAAASGLSVLATELKKFMQVMATAPAVNQNIIQMVNALARLAAQGGRVGSASRNLVGGLDRTSSAMNRTRKSTLSLAAAFGKFYASYFLVIRGIKGFMRSIEETTDYIEAFNYYNVAFGKIASEWDKDFEKYGYENAESYAESFTQRMNKTLGKLSGVQVNLDTGLLEETGLQNLGLNIQQITQYASQLASVTNSIGQTGEVSLAAAKSMTMLAGDISSLFNVDYQSVANNLQSGLIGQSRALYKYGIDITNATLANYAYNLGLEKSVSEMTQAEKMQLRMLAILDQSKVSWGDLANTINSPSNMLRQFTNNAKELSMVFGQLFIPALQKVMPVINGITIALKRLLVSFAQILGIKIDFDAFGQGYSEMEDGADGLSDALGNVAVSAKKAKAGLRAFDELKVINMPDASAAGAGGAGGAIDLTDEILKATEEYEKAWNEAFAKMENTAQAWADKIEKALEPIKKIFKDFAIGDFFQAGQDTSALVTGIFDFFADAIDRVDWNAIGQKIGDFIAGIDWPTIFKAAGNLMRQALKAAFELYVGAFSSAPLETALVSLVAFPKLLKAITASKFITGVTKLWKKFKVWGEKISLVTGALTGNEAAASGLYMLYPKLSKKVDAVKTAFSNFGKSVSQKGLWKTIDGGITNIRNNLGGLQKAAIVAVAGFAEFSVVSDSVEKLTLGTENWLAEIGKIAGVVAAAGAAMYVALGPAGLAVTAIVGVVGAIKGINDAFDTIRAQEIGESIKNAMSNPGGVPLSEVTAQFSDAIGKIGESFTVITEKAAGLEQADSHIRDTWMEIEKIETAMETGVMSVEEGTAELTRLFGELATTASDKFGQLEDTLLVAFGENGVLNEVFERLGISTDNTTSTIIQLNDKVEKRIEELTKLLAETDPSNPNYAIYKEELAGLMTQTDELTQAISNYDAALQNIDYSDLILPDGTLDTAALQNFLDELKTATETANADIENAINTTRQSLEQEKSLAESLGDWVAAEEIQEKLDALPKAMELLQGDVSLKAVALTDTVQNDFIGRMNSVIEDAKTEWGEKGFWGQIWNGVFGAGTEGEFVKEAVDQQVENIGQLSSAIETELGDLKVDGIAWGNDAIKAIYNSLFDTEYHFSDMGGGKTVYSLNEDFKSLINGATEGISELAKERGKDATDGYASGFSDSANLQNAQEAAKTFTEKVLDMIPKAQESNSPSKVTMALGKDATDGYAEGFRNKENILNAQNAASEFTSSILDKFSEVIAPLNQIGIDAMQGLLNGLSSMESSVYSKAGEIADNVANSVKNALDIHSPSRVMFALGDYTMQGFKEGMENLYNPITDSIKAFSYDVSVAPAPSLTDMYGGYQYQAAYTPQYGITEYPQSGYGQSDPELKSLLRRNNELLSAILAKPNIEKGEIYSVMKELYQRDSIRRYGNPSAYDPILGS